MCFEIGAARETKRQNDGSLFARSDHATWKDLTGESGGADGSDG